MPDLSWFENSRYGMFVHFGPYSVAARGEWVMNRERIPVEDYGREYVDRWTAERFDAPALARLARTSGMGYVVLTTRHHDGFCLWDSATTGWTAVKRGPRRDLVREFAEAVRAEGLRVGFYFSGADWSNPDYPGAFHRDWPKEWSDEDARQRFVAAYRAQLVELMTGYGRVDMLWYDGCIPQPLDGAETNRRVRELQPDILINERNGAPFDFRNSEQTLTAKDGPWEACMTLNGNWGWHAGDRQWKSATDVCRMLVTTAGMGGNLLLNVGPKGDGSLPAQTAAILGQAGAWVARHREFLPRSGRQPFAWNNSALISVLGNAVYLHFFNDPGSTFRWCELANRVLAATCITTGEPVAFTQHEGRVLLSGLRCTDPVATVVRLDVEGVPRPLQPQGTFWIPD
jgi:alpha-L-fucosidase